MADNDILDFCVSNSTKTIKVSIELLRFELVQQITIDFSFSIGIIVANSLFLSKYLHKNVLINVNLKVFLIAHVFAALVHSFNRLLFVLLNLSALLINPCHVLKLPIDCRFLSAPTFMAYVLVLNLIVFISIERCIASYRFETYFDVKLYIYAVLAIFLALVGISILEIRSLNSLKSYNFPTVCISAVAAGESTALFNFICLTFFAFLCAILMFCNKLWNGWMLQKFCWYNRGKFNLRSRFQLYNNIEVDGSIFMMIFWFFLTISTLVVFSVFLRWKHANQNSVVTMATVSNMRFAIFVQQLYFLFYIVAYFLGSRDFRRRKAREKINKWLHWLMDRNCFHSKVDPHIVSTAAQDDHTKKYFQELHDLWK